MMPSLRRIKQSSSLPSSCHQDTLTYSLYKIIIWPHYLSQRQFLHLIPNDHSHLSLLWEYIVLEMWNIIPYLNYTRMGGRVGIREDFGQVMVKLTSSDEKVSWWRNVVCHIQSNWNLHKPRNTTSTTRNSFYDYNVGPWILMFAALPCIQPKRGSGPYSVIQLPGFPSCAREGPDHSYYCVILIYIC